MRGFLRWLLSEWSGRLLLASYAPLAVVDGLAWTEPKHGANWVLFGTAVGAWAAFAVGAVIAARREGRRARRHSEDMRRAVEDLQRQMPGFSAYVAMSCTGALGTTLELRSPTSPLDKSVPAEPRAEPIVGFRLFELVEDELESVGMRSAPAWGPGENVAQNFMRAGAPPMPGFWALRTLELAKETQLTYPKALVVVAAELYGRVVEHERGWRGEKARIVAVAGLAPLEYGLAVFQARPSGGWDLVDTIWGKPEDVRAEFMARSWGGEAAATETWRRDETAAPIDVTDVGRHYGVPVFSSLEGLEAFAREMGADG